MTSKSFTAMIKLILVNQSDSGTTIRLINNSLTHPCPHDSQTLWSSEPDRCPWKQSTIIIIAIMIIITTIVIVVVRSLFRTPRNEEAFFEGSTEE